MSNYSTPIKTGDNSGGAGSGTVKAISFNGVGYSPDSDGVITFNFTQQQADWLAEAGPTFIQNKPTLFSGDYDDLANKPFIPEAQVPSDWDATEGPSQILNKPSIPAAPVQSDWNATEGLAFILNKPNLGALATAIQSGTNLGTGVEVYKQSVGTALQFKTLVAGTNVSIVPSEDGNTLIISSTGGGGGGDSGVQSISFNGVVYGPDENGRVSFLGATTAQGAKADTALQSADVAPVAISGSYDDLANKPTIPAAQVPSDWNASEGPARILNKPTIPAAAKQLVAGDNIELSETPTQITITAVLPDAGEVTLEQLTVLATAVGQTEFTIPGGYPVGAITVHLDGSTLAKAHYTASNGTTVVLANGADIVVGSELIVVRFQPLQIADVVTQSQFNSHVGQRGVAQHPVASTAQAGFMPPMPPSDDKFYAFKNGTLVEVTAGGGGGGNLLDVQFFLGLRSAIATERPGWLPMDGQLATRSIYPEATAKALTGTLYPLSPSDTAWLADWSEHRKFSPGDGSSTIRLPDFNSVVGGKAVFLRGSKVDSFSLKEDMIQNITGQFEGRRLSDGSENLFRGTGAFTSDQLGASAARTSAAVGAALGADRVIFDASRVARTGTETVPAHAEGVWLIRMAGGASNPGTVDVTALATLVEQQKAQIAALQPVVISGIVGFIGTPGISGPNAKIPFSTSFWSNKGGITYDSPNRRFYLPSAGTYRVQISGLNTASTGNRVLVGLNTDLPTIGNHRGVVYTNLSNQDLGLESTFDVPAGSYICFLLLAGSLNNAADNILGQFSIEKVG